MKLNLGAGDVKLDGFVTVDYDAHSRPDYQLNIETDPLPFEDNSVTVVVAHHILEHLGEGYFHTLKELYRVCAHGATIDIRVPHHRCDYFFDDPTHRRPITVGGLRLFSRKYNQLCRDQGAASSRLGDYFGVDFEIADFSYRPMPEYRAHFEGQPRDQVERYISEHWNICDELWVKWVVIKHEE